MIDRVLRAVESGEIPSGQFGAVMIDEGHDFKPNWYRLAVQMTNPRTESLLVLYDDAQNIYNSQERSQFSFKSVGIKAQGRTKVLKVNYRNTEEILNVSYGFAQDLLTPSGVEDDDRPILVRPETSGRHGLMPQLVRLTNFHDEKYYIGQFLGELNMEGTPWKDMGILYASKRQAKPIFQHFKDMGFPIDWVTASRENRDYNPSRDSVKLVTMHSSKGLEFPVICIPGLGFLPNKKRDFEEQARLLYVAMTRALESLVLTYSYRSDFVARLENSLASIQT